MTTAHMTETKPFGSMLTAMVTPFDSDGAVDYDGVARLAEYLVDLGNDGIVVNGTTGESATTTDEEKDRILRTVIATVGGRATILAGTGTNSTAHSIELSEAAASAGADGLLLVAPYYNKPPQAGVVAHYRAIADSTELPVLLYDIPGRTGIEISRESYQQLAEHPRIKAVKDATANVEKAALVMRETGLAWYSGDDGLNLAYLAVGGVGFVSVIGHLVADRMAEQIKAHDSGDLTRARELNFALAPVAEGVFRTQGVILAKAALNHLGLPAGPVRLPLVDATPEQFDTLRRDLAEGQVSGFAS